ncbi:MAG TPA: glycosyltransferase, partial [Candidatus Angelobacter sp.]|nr:glycosyltransferase [Candidatus Angelobacter sp.]
GDARLPAHGVDRLLAAAARAREHGTDVEVTVVCRPGQEPPGPTPDWVRIERAEGAAIHDLLSDVVATVLPRPRSAYNDLALPVKLYDYLAMGRPLLVTDCAEQARVVREAGAGLVVGDGIDDLAAGIERLGDAGQGQRDAWAHAAHAAAAANSWSDRARTIVGLIGATR